MEHNVKISSHYLMECWREGRLAWVEEFDNIVVTVGKNILLDSTFKTGVTSPTWFVGLVDGAVAPTYAAGDTMASHAGWVENAAYTESTRSAYVTDTIVNGVIANQNQKSSYNVNANGTLAGGFLVNNSTKSGTTGTLFGEASFAAGNRAVFSSDLILVTVTITVS